MELVRQTLELSIPGRWGRADRTDIAVRDAFTANKDRPYLHVESLKTGSHYLLTPRYDGDRFEDLQTGRMIAVVIGKLKEGASLGEFAISRKTEEYFAYYGGGTIQVIDAEMKSSREKRKSEGGFISDFSRVFDRWLGRKND